MTAPTAAEAVAQVRALAATLTERGSIGPAADVLGLLDAALVDGEPVAAGSFRAWCQTHHGRPVDALQVTGGGARGWMPLGRVLDASRTTFATFDGSRRDYAGVRVLSATTAGLLAVDDGGAVLVYRARE